MAENVVNFKLMGDSSSFKRAMTEASESAQNLQKGFKQIGVAIGGFLGVGAVVNAFSSIYESAQQARDSALEFGTAIDASTLAVARAADGWDNLKKGVVEVGIKTVGVFTYVGEELGKGWLRWMQGLTDAQMEQNAKFAKAEEENEKRRAAIRANNTPEKILEAQTKAAADLRDELVRAADGQEKINLLLEKEVALRAERAKLGNDTVAIIAKDVEIQKNQIAISEATAEYSKKTADDTERELKAEKDLNDEKFKAVADLAKQQDRLAKARFEAMTDEEKIVELQRQQGFLQYQIAQSKKLGLDTTEEEADLQELVNDLTSRQNDLLKQQAEAEAKITGEKKEQQKIMVTGMRWRTSENFKDSSDAELAELVRRNRQDAINVQNLPRFGADRIWNMGEVARLNGEADNAQAELDFRKNLRFQVNTMGVDFARTQFKGDPLLFDSIVQKYVQDSRDVLATNKQAVDRLQDLNDRLAKIGLNK